MGPLFRDRIFLLKFLCTTGALDLGIVWVNGAGVMGTLFDRTRSGTHS
jgi:hypothetical protein